MSVENSTSQLEKKLGSRKDYAMVFVDSAEAIDREINRIFGPNKVQEESAARQIFHSELAYCVGASPVGKDFAKGSEYFQNLFEVVYLVRVAWEARQKLQVNNS